MSISLTALGLGSLPTKQRSCPPHRAESGAHRTRSVCWSINTLASTGKSPRDLSCHHRERQMPTSVSLGLTSKALGGGKKERILSVLSSLGWILLITGLESQGWDCNSWKGSKSASILEEGSVPPWRRKQSIPPAKRQFLARFPSHSSKGMNTVADAFSYNTATAGCASLSTGAKMTGPKERGNLPSFEKGAEKILKWLTKVVQTGVTNTDPQYMSWATPILLSASNPALFWFMGHNSFLSTSSSCVFPFPKTFVILNYISKTWNATRGHCRALYSQPQINLSPFTPSCQSPAPACALPQASKGSLSQRNLTDLKKKSS